jgi:RsiW-degrading membrane proteinase PrsW (M82 family)
MQWPIALLLGIAPGLIWLFFFLRQDNRPEPKSMILATFLAGAFSAMVALFLQAAGETFFKESISFILPGLLEENMVPYLAFALIEEGAKFLLVYLVVRRSKYFDEPVDAMVYMITGALGFATLENIFLAYSNGGDGLFGLMLLRFIGATLLHALGSGIIGHYWARGIKFKMEAKFVFAGILMATLFHAIFNVLVLHFSDYLVYPIAFLVLIGFFVLYDFEELKKLDELKPAASSAPPVSGSQL